jgi:hypothetical protein
VDFSPRVVDSRLHKESIDSYTSVTTLVSLSGEGRSVERPVARASSTDVVNPGTDLRMRLAFGRSRPHQTELPLGAWRSLASAPEWGSGGRRFESSRPDLTYDDGSFWIARILARKSPSPAGNE